MADASSVPVSQDDNNFEEVTDEAVPVEGWSVELERQFLEGADEGDTELLARLLKTYPDDLRATHPENWSTLHEALLRACVADELDAVKLLADLWPNDQVETFLSLINPEYTKFNILHLAAGKGACEIAEYLLDAGVDPMRRSEDGETALHYACKSGHLDAMCAIFSCYRRKRVSLADEIEKYEDVLINAQDDCGRTCLHLAALHNHEAIVAWLLKIGACVDIKDDYKQTAWEIAASIETCANSQSVFALEDKNANESWRHFVHADVLFGGPGPWVARAGYIDLTSAEKAHEFWIYLPVAKAALRQISLRCKLGVARILIDQALPLVNRNFLEDYEVNEFLRAREPTCIWDDLGSYTEDMEEAPKPEWNGSRQAEVSDDDRSRNSDYGSVDETWIYGRHRFMSLVMPYFHSDTLRSLNSRLQEYISLTERSKYCNSDRRELHGVHLPLTLDEYCNPGLPPESLEKRNKDQVLARKALRSDSIGQSLEIRAMKKEGKMTRGKRALDETRILTVQQLWLWRIGEIIVISVPGASKWLIKADNEADRLDEGRRNSYLAIAIILSRLIKSLDRPKQAGLPEPPFNTYANEIDSILESVQQYAQGEGVDDLHIQKEKQFVHEIGDIRDELSMIKSVVLQQEEVWREFSYGIWPECWPDGQEGRFRAPRDSTNEELRNNWRVVTRPLQLIQKYKRKIDRLDEEAARVEAKIMTLLDLKSKHASIKETHATAIMSAAIFGFTIITIIFTPLGFVTGLFSLPIEGFQNGGSRYTGSYVGTWAVTTEIVSVALTLLLMWAAVRFGMGVHLFNRKRKLKTELEKPLSELEKEKASSKSGKNEMKRVSGDNMAKRSFTQEQDFDMV